MTADYHVHTYFSDDSTCPMEDMLRRAVELGLDELAFTEHVDYGVKTDLNCDYAAYFDELARMQERFAGRLTIRRGIEFGVQTHTVEQFQKDFERYPFDFVILSNHQIGDREFWRGEYQQGKSQEEIHRDYYTAILEVMQLYRNYSVLGHLDMIKRYNPYGDYPDEKVMDLVDAILRRAIADGKGIEINTSCFRYKLKDLTPSRTILRRYHELGGEVLTFGSDAHKTENLAERMDEARDAARSIGFRYFCTFEGMTPTFQRL